MESQWWLIWLGIALVAGVAEIFTLGLVFVMVAGGALAGAAVAGLTDSWIASVLTFVGSTALLLVAVRPPLLKYSQQIGPPAPVGIEALVGRAAEVVAPVDRHTGQVKLAGEIWTARAEAPGDVLELGSTVYVARIDGATAVVNRFRHDPAHDPAHDAVRDPSRDPSRDRSALPGGEPPTHRPEK